jgi:hypothetical protein
MARYHFASALAVTLALLASAPSARAEGPDPLARLRETLKREPKAPDVVKMALDYYRVSPAAMDSVRSAARTRALMPVLSGFVTYDSVGSASASATTITNPANVVVNNAQSITAINGGLAWDFRELIFNPTEVQTYAVVPMQRDIMLEVVRTYYLRRQLQIRLALKPPADPLALATLELRVEEYTGILTSMTGGSFLRVASAATTTNQ